VLYSRAIAPFWDVQIGWRGDLLPKPEHNWLGLDIKGLHHVFLILMMLFLLVKVVRHH
jgi:copper resistance protein B